MGQKFTGASGLENTTGSKINPATEEKQDAIITAITGSIDSYNTNDIDEASATLTYIGTESEAGAYLIKKIDTTTGNSFQYASVNNNPTYTTYDTAWTARASLNYDNYGNVL